MDFHMRSLWRLFFLCTREVEALSRAAWTRQGNLGNAVKSQIDYIFTTSTYVQKAVGGVQNQFVFSHANQFVFLLHCVGLFCNRHIKLWTWDYRILRMYGTEYVFWIVGHATVTTQSCTNFQRP